MPTTPALTEEQQTDADFTAGFDTPAPPATETKAPVVEVKTDEGKPTEAEVKTEVKVEEPKPEYVQLTKEERDRLLAVIDKTTEFGTKLDRALGTFGNVQDVVKKLQAATPAGVNVELTDEDFAELEADYPGLAGQIKVALQKSFGRLKGTAPAVVETKAPEKSIAELIKEDRDAQQIEALDEAYPEWRETVGKFGDDKNAFRIWLATQPADYQKRINNTRSALTIGGAIDKFIASKKAPAPAQAKTPDGKVTARTDRIAGAVQPKGDGRPPPRRDNSDDEFEAGFAGR